MSRIVSGRIRLDVPPLDLASIVASSVETLKMVAAGKSISLQLNIDPLIGTISGDSARLQQVFWNLLDNAIKFTPKGGRVQVRIRRVESHIEFSVLDNGDGIDPSFLPHIFDRLNKLTQPIRGSTEV